MTDTLLFLAGGLVLFLYAISELSKVMQSLFSERAKKIISKTAGNSWLAVMTGTLITVLLDSSSAVIILLIVFINAGSLNLRQGLGIIMGANIGTTFSSQIIAMDVSKYSVIPLLIGLLIQVLSKNEQWKKGGEALLYFGMLFFGLFIMESSVAPLQDSDFFKDWLVRIDKNYVKGSLVGGLITLIIQSSSGTVGMVIVLAKKNIISLSAGISVMLGAELGTCSDTLIATIGGSRAAVKAGIFHLFFNVITIALGLIFFSPFVSLVEWISEGQALSRQIANAHMLFNCLGVLVFFPFIAYFEGVLNQMIPERT